MTDGARLAQRGAADPAQSAWVAANAGSGKTRVLTERVARLLLEGASPGKILCLTYTKAAAAEMQDRLFRMLGGWAMATDEDLAAALTELAGEASTVEPDRARRLFAEALETPGGLKIQTIHAFCDSLLRRFPLEAGAPPDFAVMESREQEALIAETLDAMAAAEMDGVPGAFAGIAAILNESGIEQLAKAVVSQHALFPPDVDEAEFCEAFGVPAPPDPESGRIAAFRKHNPDMLARMRVAWVMGEKTDQKRAQALAEATVRGEGDLAIELVAAMLTKEGEVRKNPASKAAQAAEPNWETYCRHLAEVALAISEAERAAVAAERALRLARFGGAFITRYTAAKAAASRLDFDDLVGKARALLTTAEMAQWALYRLDGGIDHILVDEAQDTAPGQWDVIAAIAREFSAGQGARDTARTAFVVGDEKQSIYRFQGAAPGKFAEMRDVFAQDFAAMGGLRQAALQASFRSAPAILAAVDATFAGTRGEGLTADDKSPVHQAFHTRRAGRVDIWPLVEPDPPGPEPEPWSAVDLPGKREPRLRLAKAVADRIAVLIATGHLPGGGRRIVPGDIIVLVQNRKPMMAPLIRYLKQNGVPVAGVDRLSLPEELAVKDLLALMRFAVTERDDLSLAAVLRSPLGSVSEEGLFDLAYDRKGATLWSRLRAQAARWPEDVKLMEFVRRASDFIRPHEFLQSVLIDFDGRRRLIARLGPEADDPIDELLALALDYEAAETPSLTGFLDWIGGGEAEIKRQNDTARDEVRVMSAHGAKGLESPIVILPDTMRKPSNSRPEKITEISVAGRRRAAWTMSKGSEPCLLADARGEVDKADAAEHRRLLYVAMTRAEDWLIVAGAGKADEKALAGTWYELVQAGFADLPTRTEPVAGMVGDALVMEEAGEAKGRMTERAHAALLPDVPDWVGTRPAAPPVIPRRYRASDLTSGMEIAPGGAFAPEIARRRGDAIHAILEGASASESDMHKAIAPFDLSAEIAEGVVREARAVRAMAQAASFFGPDALAEVAISTVQDGRRIAGRIDRMIVTDQKILFVDFKSDSQPPADATVAPEAYLAQMAAYRAALAGIYPGRQVEAHILWTAVPRLDRITDTALDGVLARVIANLEP